MVKVIKICLVLLLSSALLHAQILSQTLYTLPLEKKFDLLEEEERDKARLSHLEFMKYTWLKSIDNPFLVGKPFQQKTIEATIKTDSGKILFQREIVSPKSWSDTEYPSG